MLVLPVRLLYSLEQVHSGALRDESVYKNEQTQSLVPCRIQPVRHFQFRKFMPQLGTDRALDIWT